MLRMTLDQARDLALANMGGAEVEHRREAERLWLARQAADEAYYEAYNKRPRDEPQEVSDAHPDVAPLIAVLDAAEAAWQAIETNGDVVIDLETDEPLRCALTNLIIHDDDAVVEHTSGKRIHLAALGLDNGIFDDEETEGAANDDLGDGIDDGALDAASGFPSSSLPDAVDADAGEVA